MSPPRKAVIFVTSATAKLHGDNSTGLFITEALHPFQVFTEAGFEVDLVSEKQAYTEDWLSMTPDFLNGKDKEQYEDKTSAFRKKLDNMPDPKTIDGKNYGIFFASAGHAALIDFPHAKSLHKIASDVWNSGGVASSVCHGPAIFPGVIDSKTQKPVIEGKVITGFTTQAESDMGIMEVLRSWKEPLVDETAEKLGAKYVRASDVWQDFVIADGRVVSGMNPQSAKSAAQAAVHAYEKL